MLNRIKKTLRNGYSLCLGPYVVTLTIGRGVRLSTAEANLLADSSLRQLHFLRNKYPPLAQVKIPVEGNNATELLHCYLELVPLMEPDAKEVCIRNALHHALNRTNDPRLKALYRMEIARSDLRSGIPDRAKALREDEDLCSELERQLRSLDQAYGASLSSQSWPNASRGRSLCYYFESHEDLLRNKRVLHFSPEPELREWILRRARNLGLTYQTSNISANDTDFIEDLTALTIKDNAYDFVICHRVLEHVLDDMSAFRELYRIVEPGGLLQISVPQSVHQAKTREWVVPDETHDGHVRHYGCDFSSRLESVGFTVETETWLLERSREELLANGAYPLRMYYARKRERGA